MADRTIGELPVADRLDDESLLVVEQQGEARSIQGLLVRRFAEAATEGAVQAAQAAALAAQERLEEQAEQSAQDAANSADQAAKSADEAAESAQSAQQYSGKPPRIQNGTWWIWNAGTQQYEDTGEAARGNVMYATFAVTPETGELIMTTPDEYRGPVFYLVNGILEVAINHA